MFKTSACGCASDSNCNPCGLDVDFFFPHPFLYQGLDYQCSGVGRQWDLSGVGVLWFSDLGVCP